MTKAEIMNVVKNIRNYLMSGNPIWDTDTVDEAMSTAIDALQRTHNTFPTHECVEPTHGCVDLISRNAAIRAFAEYEKRTTPSWSGAYKETLEEWIDELTETLSDIPTIDLVYCRECKYWDGSECQCEWASTDHEGGASYSLDRDADDFCSYGERR